MRKIRFFFSGEQWPPFFRRQWVDSVLSKLSYQIIRTLSSQTGIPHRKKKFSKNFAPLRKNEADFIRIKSSQRTGRFHHHSVRRDDDDPGVASRPQFYGGIVPPPHPEMPILFRAFRFFSTMLRGGPMG